MHMRKHMHRDFCLRLAHLGLFWKVAVGGYIKLVLKFVPHIKQSIYLLLLSHRREWWFNTENKDLSTR